ncbi:MAG TPA: permease-like cell division protein FtsX [Bacteroidaceae bacterium]|nr:permease-like cell division protein FtsX [Bacteroidaceae bacterium]
MTKKKRKIDLLFITSCISTSLVLMLIGIITLMLLTARDIAAHVRQEMKVEVILKEDISDSQANALRNNITRAPYCAELTVISKEDALSEMTVAMGSDPTMFLDYNPFYASLNIKLNENYASNDSLVIIEKELSAMAGVKEVTWQKEILDSMNDNIRKIAAVLLVLVFILSLISFTLIRNTIRLTIYSQRFILYSMKLVGAKWSFIRQPFVKRNLLIGLASSALACLAIWGGLKLGVNHEPWLTPLLGKKIVITVSAVILLTGLTVPYLCALGSVNRFLRMKSGELHYL